MFGGKKLKDLTEEAGRFYSSHRTNLRHAKHVFLPYLTFQFSNGSYYKKSGFCGRAWSTFPTPGFEDIRKYAASLVSTHGGRERIETGKSKTRPLISNG